MSKEDIIVLFGRLCLLNHHDLLSELKESSGLN